MHTRLRIGIVGAGISGLSAAHYLSEFDAMVTIYERAPVPGGRANVTRDGEHCPRVFLDDYSHLFRILRSIRGNGGSVHDDLRPLRRLGYSERLGWLEISHLYQVLAKEVPLRERLAMVKLRPRSPLVAEGANTNRYGSRRNFTYRSLVRMALSLLRSRTAYAFDGPTDELLIGPWVRHLASRGVDVRLDAKVTSIAPHAEGVRIDTAGTSEEFDALVLTAFVPDVIDLLDASAVGHRLVALNHTHCRCLTVYLDPRENLPAGQGPALYCRGGINILLQPAWNRCVVLCTWTPSTVEAHVLSMLREYLRLGYDPVSVRVRENQRPDEAVYAATYVRSNRILTRSIPRIYFAGSYVDNTYPVDSGEGAARTAAAVVRRIRAEHGLGAGSLVQGWQ